MSLRSLTLESIEVLKKYEDSRLQRFELAEILNVHRQHVEYWNRSGKITKYKAPNKYPYYIASEVYNDLKKAIQSQKRKRAPKVVMIESED